MTRAMNTLILTRAHYRRRYGNDAPEASVPSRFLEEVPQQLVENLSGTASPAWSTPGYGGRGGYGSRYGNRAQAGGDTYTSSHFNYEDESQERPAFGAGNSSRPKSNSAQAPNSIDNIARFFGGKGGPGKFGGKTGSFARPAMEVATPAGAAGLGKGARVRHAKYGEGTVLYREGEGEDAKLTVMFQRHGMKKLMEKFANLEKI
jgi:DNA helicase-2/ATP-dependent DNA helicase PcrA